MSLNDLEFCTINSGVRLSAYDEWRKILNALYYALNIGLFCTHALFGDVFINMHEDVKIKIYSGGTLVDFRIEDKKFWALGVSLFGVPFEIPLPSNFKTVSFNMLENLLKPINPKIPGSDN